MKISVCFLVVVMLLGMISTAVFASEATAGAQTETISSVSAATDGSIAQNDRDGHGDSGWHGDRGGYGRGPGHHRGPGGSGEFNDLKSPLLLLLAMATILVLLI